MSNESSAVSTRYSLTRCSLLVTRYSLHYSPLTARCSPLVTRYSSLLHDQIPLHLLVERRAEVRAVVREHAGFVRLEGERLRLSRVHDDVDVVVEQAEAVEHVGLLLDVGHGHRHRVTLLHLER